MNMFTSRHDPVPTPREVFEQLQKHLAAAERLRSWNEQMVEVVNVVRQAQADGTGVLIRYSTRDNTVDAEPTTHCNPGQAVVLDRDKVDPDHGMPQACVDLAPNLFGDRPPQDVLRAAAYRQRVTTGVIEVHP